MLWTAPPHPCPANVIKDELYHPSMGLLFSLNCNLQDDCSYWVLGSSLGINKPRRDPPWVGLLGELDPPSAPRVPPHPRECIPISITGGHTSQHMCENPHTRAPQGVGFPECKE